ncbi:glutathione degradosome [Xylariomycetidae sp. FL2044]|nr:glutathione degradosome [Xylariomycetidae sp. FL2044]
MAEPPKRTREPDGCVGCQKILDNEAGLSDDDSLLSTSLFSSSTTNYTEELEGMMTSSAALTAPSPILEVAPHTTPELYHSLKHNSSIIALVVSNDCIYAGTQDGEIVVWTIGTFQQKHRIQAHKRSVMCLHLSEDGSLLFSSASDPIVNIWSPNTMERLYEIYSLSDSFGDIYSVTYSSRYDTVYYGAQDTSIQWVKLKDTGRRVTHESQHHPDRRNHKFFDSRAVGGASTPRPTDERYDLMPRPRIVLETDIRAKRMFAHFGYCYCMIVAKGICTNGDPNDEVLISGGGDGTVKVWKLGGEDIGDDGYLTGIEEIMLLGEEDCRSVMCLAIDGSFLYSGKHGGIVELWDLDTKHKLRSIKAHKGDIMAMEMGWGYLWSAARTGTASKHSTSHYGNHQSESSHNVSQKYQPLTVWQAHNGKILSAATATHGKNHLFITGANDNTVAVWLLANQATGQLPSHGDDEDMMITSLREFVSYKTVSSRREYAEDCRRGATFLRTLFQKLGGDVDMLSTEDEHDHPVVLAEFKGRHQPAKERKRVLFYGHYDVVPAESKSSKWEHDPFQLIGTDGYLYGRGVSDNKGPVMAALYAVTDLMQAKSLESDVIFLIEGQEESGSRGFKEIVRNSKDRIGRVDHILLANSYWINDDTPCLTYGLRGVMHATICVESKSGDRHSGVDGSYMVNEPLSDLMALLSKLKGPRNRVMISGFYDGILPLTPEEEARYDDILSVLMEQSNDGVSADVLKANLKARWREPNLTHHMVKVSGPDGSLISSHANAKVSVRLVPGQQVEEITSSLTDFLEAEFSSLESDNKFTIQIDNEAEPWLGDPGNDIFRTLEKAVIEAWTPLFFPSDDKSVDEVNSALENINIKPSNGVSTEHSNGATNHINPTRLNGTSGENNHDIAVHVNGSHPGARSGKNGAVPKLRKPLYIREGGSIPAIRFLEKEFNAPAAHLPCGQASDAAHLDNERLRVLNLFKSREIFRYVFTHL